MTQSNFKYSTGQAGSTLFEPKKESKPFDPFDIQAASQPILDALKENKQIEVDNLGRTGDYGLASMKIEHQHEEALARHNANVARINDEYDFEQLSKFSESAQQLFQMGVKHKAEQSKKKALTNFIKLKVHNPELAAKLVKDWDKIKDANDEIINAGALQGHLQLHKKNFPGDAKSLRLAQAWIDSSGWERQALRKAMLADQKKLIGERIAFLKENHIPEWTKSEANPEGFTLQQMVEGDPTGYHTDEQYAAFKAEINGIILERHFIPFHSVQTIATEVLPALDKFDADSDKDRAAQGLYSTRAQHERTQNEKTVKAIDSSYGMDEGYIGREIAKDVYQISGPMEASGTTASEKMSAAWNKKIDNIADLFEAGAITYPQVLLAMKGEFEIQGQGKTNIDTWRSKEVAETGFWKRINDSVARQNKINELNKENIIKVGVNAMRDQFIANDNRPISEPTFQLLVDKLHEMGGGIRSDIEEKLREAQPTVHGLRVEEELDNMSWDFKEYGKLNPENYGRYSHEAMMKARKNGWLQDPAHILSSSELKSARDDISDAALKEAKRQGEENQDTTNIEIRARRLFKSKFDNLVTQEAFRNNKQGAYDLALSESVAEAKKNYKDWLKPITREELINKKAIAVRKDITENVEIGADVQTYAVPAHDERMEWLKEKIENFKKNNPNGDWRSIINQSTKYPADDGEGGTTDELFFDTSVTNNGTGQGRYLYIEQQLRARNFDPDKGSNIKPLAPADNTNREFNPGRVDVYHTETDIPFDIPEGGDKLIGKTFGEVTSEEWQSIIPSEGLSIDKEQVKVFLKSMGYKPGYTIEDKSLQQIVERLVRLDQGLVKAPTIFDNPRNKIKHTYKEDAKANRQLGDEKEMDGRIYVYSVITGPGSGGGVYKVGWKLKGGLLGALFGGGT